MKLCTNRFKFWYDEDKNYHRENGPAVEYTNGDKRWYKHGKFHRENGPAVESAGGDKYWYQNGLSHREDGPAVECSNGDKYWWYEGERLPSYVQTVEQLKSYIRNKVLW